MARGKKTLASMSVDALLALRDRIGTVLSGKTSELRRQIAQLELGGRASSRRGAQAGSRRGRKIAPKYRDPDEPSNVWAGRGALPRWMQAKIKAGAKKEDFLIGSSDGAPRKRRSAKKKTVKRTKRASAPKKRASKKRKPAAATKRQPDAGAAST